MILIYLEVVDYHKNSQDYSDSEKADQGDQGALTIGALDVDCKAFSILYVAEEGGDAEAQHQVEDGTGDAASHGHLTETSFGK